MDTIYSLSLLASFAAGMIALILALTLLMKHPQLGPCRLRSFRRALAVIISVALNALFISRQKRRTGRIELFLYRL